MALRASHGPDLHKGKAFGGVMDRPPPSLGSRSFIWSGSFFLSHCGRADDMAPRASQVLMLDAKDQDLQVLTCKGKAFGSANG